jgi:phosphopantothenate synthetase
VKVSCEIVTEAFPALVRVIVCELLVPVVTFPKATEPGVAFSVDCVPVPLSAIVSGELGALLTTEMLPVVLPELVGLNAALIVADCPAVSVNGVVTPDTLKPAPATLTCETVTFADPVFVSVMDCDPVLPTLTLPKFSLVGDALSCPTAPVPFSAIVRGEFGALLTTEMLPVALPEVVGLNDALIVAVCPAVSVNGVFTPEILNAAPVTLTCEIVTFADPVFVSVMDCDPVLPTPTLPKFSLIGDALSCPTVPVPLSAIVSGEFGPLLTTEMLPVALPEPFGANDALIVADCPAVSVNGVVTPETVKPAPVTFTCDTVTLAVPLFLSVMDCEFVLPTLTLPKFSLVGDAPSCACVPVPLSAIVNGEFGPLFATETLPFAAPAVVGANCAVNVVLCPAAIVSGVEMPVMLKPAPLAVAEVTVKLAEPELVNVTVWVPLLPTATGLKFTLPGLAVSWP